MSDDGIKLEGMRGIFLCPSCGKKIDLLRFGNGWVGRCCGQIVYNSDGLPEGKPGIGPDPASDVLLTP